MREESIKVILEEILKCRWMLRILSRLYDKPYRPGALKRALPGISSKVLYERLQKLLSFGLVHREEKATIPPAVFYSLSNRGKKLAELFQDLNIAAPKNRAGPKLPRGWCHTPQGIQKTFTFTSPEKEMAFIKQLMGSAEKLAIPPEFSLSIDSCRICLPYPHGDENPDQTLWFLQEADRSYEELT